MSNNSNSQIASLIRTDTLSTVSTNATAPNLPGPGRNIGLLLDRVGKHVETIFNKCATRFKMGPVATARKIRQLRRYDELTVQERYSLPPMQLPKSEAKKLRRYCDKLLKFIRCVPTIPFLVRRIHLIANLASRSKVLSTQLDALEEVTKLAIEDSLVRALLAECRLDYLEPKYLEPDLLLLSAKAFASIKEAETHKLWSSMILRQYSELDQESIKMSLSCVVF